MGIYLYAIRAKNHRITLPDGTQATAHVIDFVFNGGSFYTPTNLQKAMQAKIEKYWEGKPLPEYVIKVYKGVQQFDQVYRWTAKHPFWIDTDHFPGERVGDVLEIRRGNIQVGEHTHQPADPARMTPHIDMTTGQSRCSICHTSFGEPNPEKANEYRKKLEEDLRASREREKREQEEYREREARARHAKEVREATEEYEKAVDRLKKLGVEPPVENKSL